MVKGFAFDAPVSGVDEGEEITQMDGAVHQAYHPLRENHLIQEPTSHWYGSMGVAELQPNQVGTEGQPLTGVIGKAETDASKELIIGQSKFDGSGQHRLGVR